MIDFDPHRPFNGGLLYFDNVNSYVLPHQKQNETIANDASHKAAPSENIIKHSRRKSIYYDNKKSNNDASSVENVVLAINTGVKHFMGENAEPDVVDSISKTLVDFAKNRAIPMFRSAKQSFDIKPEIIQFRANKPSVMFEINSKSILMALKDLLRSKTIHNYMDTFTKEAAILYRSLSHEMKKNQAKRNNN